MTDWQIAPEWQGETAFIVGGGTSVSSIDLNLLRGQKVIAINASFRAAPFADFLIFADARFWEQYKNQLADWKGRMVCLSRTPRDPRLLVVNRKVPPAADQPNNCLALQWTTATAAIHLAQKLGAARIALLGIDGTFGADGKTHHHAPHPWRGAPDWQAKHRHDLALMVEPMRKLGVEIVHATPGSAYGFWPTVELAALLRPAAVAA